LKVSTCQRHRSKVDITSISKEVCSSLGAQEILVTEAEPPQKVPTRGIPSKYPRARATVKVATQALSIIGPSMIFIVGM
jgi:hypothetical protein